METELLWDLLPEEFPYEDKGCELFPSCLDCPFPDCLKEEPWGKERFLKRRRAQRMLELKQEGKSVKEIARIFEVSPRTVQRWLKVIEPASLSVIARSVSDEAISDRGLLRTQIATHLSGARNDRKARDKPGPTILRDD
jgi:DNA-binding transcriptional ArsR family regulator